MRYWSMILHFYQPPTQEPEITKTVLESCYLPLLRILSEKSGFGLTVNISGSLILQLKQMEAYEFFDLVKKLIHEGKIEIINSVMYHPLIPITPKDVVIRQIGKNSQTLKSLLDVEVTDGFFPPELAINNESLNVINSNYIMIDESSLKTTGKIKNSIVKYGQKYLIINNHQLCEIMRAYPKKLFVETLVNFMQKISDEDGLVVTVNDAELFGHHYSERLQLLVDLLDTKSITFIKASESVARFGNRAAIISDIKASSWEDCKGFSLWNKNPLQKKYLKLLHIVYELTSGNLDSASEDFFDQSNSSCYLYWLSNHPWWHPDLVEKGTKQLMKCIRSSQISGEKKIMVEKLYFNFLKDMWQYHWSGMVQIKYKEYDRKLLEKEDKWE